MYKSHASDDIIPKTSILKAVCATQSDNGTDISFGTTFSGMRRDIEAKATSISKHISVNFIPECAA